MENQSFHCQDCVISAKTLVFTMFGKPKDALKSLRFSTISKNKKTFCFFIRLRDFDKNKIFKPYPSAIAVAQLMGSRPPGW